MAMRGRAWLPVAYPLGLGLFPLLSLWAANADALIPADLVAPALWVLGAVGALAALLGALLGDRHRAGLLTGWLTLWFFAYGHAARGLHQLTGSELFLGWGFFGLWALLCGAVAWLLVRRARPGPRTSRLLGVASLGLLLVPLFSLLSPGARPPLPARGDDPVLHAPARPPDIYFIVLDGHARADVLRDVFGHDSREFLEGLRARGFRVQEQARANYMQTDLSLAATLNMTFLDGLLPAELAESSDRRPLRALLEDNRVVRLLRGQGYRLVTFATGFDATELSGADVRLAPRGALGEFAIAVLQLTPVGLLQALLAPPPADWQADADLARRFETGEASPKDQVYFAQHRERVLFTLEELERVPGLGSPKLVFAHVLSPHPPFVLGPDGEPRTAMSIYSHDEARDLIRTGRITPEGFLQGYRDQVRFIDRRVLRTLDAILARSPPETVIILQADHGSGFLLNPDDLEDSDVRERFGILSAIRLPGVEERKLRPGMSPINAFRLVLHEVFGADLKRLPDRSFFSTKRRPYAWIEVTDRLAPAPPPPDLHGVWGAGPEDFWVAGAGGTLARHDGRAFRPEPPRTRADLRAVWGADPGCLWAVGDGGAALAFDGRAWAVTREAGGRDLRGVWGAGCDAAWAVGAGGSVLRWQGAAWLPEAGAGGQDLAAVHGLGPDDLWAVGRGGAVWHREAGAWRALDSGTREDLLGVWAFAPGQAWAVGARGTVVRCDGQACAPSPPVDPRDLHAVWAPSAEEAWAVGQGGLILRYRAGRWAQAHGRTASGLNALFGLPGGAALAVGDRGEVLRLVAPTEAGPVF